MTIIRISSFGGEMPSASSRAIPPGQARRAFNLLARVNEFRPLNGDVVKATPTATNGATLYRFKIDGSGNPLANDTLGWISAAPALNYVNGQIDDLGTERVYMQMVHKLFQTMSKIPLSLFLRSIALMCAVQVLTLSLAVSIMTNKSPFYQQRPMNVLEHLKMEVA